jgi:hypothetical protein
LRGGNGAVRPLRERLAKVLATPLRRAPDGASEEMKRQVINEILDGVAAGLVGPGKSRLYDAQAKLPAAKADDNAGKFGAAIARIVKDALEKAGGKFQYPNQAVSLGDSTGKPAT